MTLRVSLNQVNSFVFSKQHLGPKAQGIGLVQVVRDVGGLHATSPMVPYLSLRARHIDFDRVQLQNALYDERSLAKVLCMRNTLFVLPKDLLPVAYQATKKQRDATVDRYLRHHEFSRPEYGRCVATVIDFMGSESLTAAEIKEGLKDERLAVVADLMPNDWQLIRARPRGSWRSSLQEYGVFQNWFPDVDLESLSAEDAQASLVSHYLSSFGPATEDDVVWWTGLGKREIRRALARIDRHAAEIEIEELGGGFLLLERQSQDLVTVPEIGGEATFLPSLDPYIMGYKGRARFLDPDNYSQVFDRAGNALPTIWLDGRVIGVWMEDRKRRSLQLLLFDEAKVELSAQLKEEAENLSRFLGHEATDVETMVYPEDVYPKTPFSLGRKRGSSLQETDHRELE
jgi:hypothetical protein